MKKIYFIILFIFIPFHLISEKYLIVITALSENYKIKKFYYNFMEIDYPYFSDYVCKNYEVPAKYNIREIIEYLSNKVIFIKSSSKFKNFSVKDKIFFQKKFIIDSKYKILEKSGKKYYIFNVCFPGKRKENIFLKIIRELFDG